MRSFEEIIYITIYQFY